MVNDAVPDAAYPACVGVNVLKVIVVYPLFWNIEYVPVVFPKNDFVSTLAPLTPELVAPVITLPNGCVIWNDVVDETVNVQLGFPTKLVPVGSVALVTLSKLPPEVAITTVYVFKTPDALTPEVPEVPKALVPDVPLPDVPLVPKPLVPLVPNALVPLVPLPLEPDVPLPEVPLVEDVPEVPEPLVPLVPNPLVPEVPKALVPLVPEPLVPLVPKVEPDVPAVPLPLVPLVEDVPEVPDEPL